MGLSARRVPLPRATCGAVARELMLDYNTLISVTTSKHGLVVADKLVVASSERSSDVCGCWATSEGGVSSEQASAGSMCECLPCGQDGCLFDVWADPYELTQIRWATTRSTEMKAKLEAARNTAWRDAQTESDMHALVGCSACYKDCLPRILNHAWRRGRSLRPWDA